MPTEIVSNVVNSIYRAALDVSFRRSGGLFVLLRNRQKLSDVVRTVDQIGHADRTHLDKEFDRIVSGKAIQSLPRSIIVDLSALDGAIVVDNHGHLLAYGAVLEPKKRGRVGAAEGSRTKAAIGASHYGLAVKISSDGDITVFVKGERFFVV